MSSNKKWNCKQFDYDVEDIKFSSKMVNVVKDQDPLLVETICFPKKKSKFIKSILFYFILFFF